MIRRLPLLILLTFVVVAPTFAEPGMGPPSLRSKVFLGAALVVIVFGVASMSFLTSLLIVGFPKRYDRKFLVTFAINVPVWIVLGTVSGVIRGILIIAAIAGAGRTM